MARAGAAADLVLRGSWAWCYMVLPAPTSLVTRLTARAWHRNFACEWSERCKYDAAACCATCLPQSAQLSVPLVRAGELLIFVMPAIFSRELGSPCPLKKMTPTSVSLCCCCCCCCLHIINHPGLSTQYLLLSQFPHTNRPGGLVGNILVTF